MARTTMRWIAAGLCVAAFVLYVSSYVLIPTQPKKTTSQGGEQSFADSPPVLTPEPRLRAAVESKAPQGSDGGGSQAVFWKQLSLWGPNAVADDPWRLAKQRVAVRGDQGGEGVEGPSSAAAGGIQPRQREIVRYLKDAGMRAAGSLGVRQPVRMTEVEKRYMATAALADFQRLAHERHSEVVIVSPKDSPKVGDKLQLRVDVRDQLGRIRDAGGDEVRVWLKSPNRDSSAPMVVSDLGNGSYLGETTLRWEGPTHVRASLTYPREFLRLVVELRHSLLTTRWIRAKFSWERGSEMTPCLPSAPIPGYARACNFTLDNGWSPWFCGHPTGRELSCGHIIHMDYLGNVSPLPLVGPAVAMDKQMNDRNRLLKLIPNDIVISTRPGPPPPQLPPCSSRPRRESWEQPSQRGWMKKPGEWIPDTCALPAFTPERVRECLRDTTVLLLGDSNMRLILIELAKVLQKETEFWFGQRFFQEPQLNSSVLFAIHAHPFHSGHPYPVMRPVSVGRALAGLPVGGRYVIVLHYYLHFAYYPLAVFTDRVRSAKRAVEEFLRAHPTAKVFIRGPHVVNGGMGNHATNGDKFGPWFLRILKQEFQDLHDRIWLLDFWPMTIAAENEDTHPPNYVTRQILSVLLGYACDKP